MEYEGCRKFCFGCKFYQNCKMIDHETIKFYQPFFKTYESIRSRRDICYYYEPADWNISGKDTWKGMDSYIEYMDKEYHELRYDGSSKLDYGIRLSLIYKGNQYTVSLKSWLDGTAIQNNQINYIFWHEINGKKRKLHNEKGSIKIN